MDLQHELQELRDYRASMLELGEECETARRDWELSNEVTKGKKKVWEGLSERLAQAARKSSEKFPLLDSRPAAIAENGLSSPLDEPEAVETDESWRNDSLASYGLPERIYAALAEAAIHTVGDLANFTASGRAITDIEGIGEKSAEKIMEADATYWSDRNARLKAAAANAEPDPSSETPLDELEAVETEDLDEDVLAAGYEDATTDDHADDEDDDEIPFGARSDASATSSLA